MIKSSEGSISTRSFFTETKHQKMAKTFISKYAPQYLRDFLCEDTDFGYRDSGAEYVLKTLIDMDDMNVLLVGGFNSGKTTMLYALAREYYHSSIGSSSVASSSGIHHSREDGSASQLLSENNVLFINNLKENQMVRLKPMCYIL